MKRVAIIGAGPMGLALAYYLRKTARPVIFEADAQPGGMSASFDFDGVLIEKYYHFINRPDERLFALLKELGLYEELRWRPTRMGFFRKDKNGRPALHEWGNPLALLKMGDVSPLTRFRYGLHAFSCKFIKDLMPLDDISAADWIKRWEGKGGYDLFWKFLFEKKFFELSEPLSAAWIASRIRRVANSRQSLMQESLGYLEGGSAGLIDKLLKEILDEGGQLRLSSRVERVEPDVNGGGGTVYAGGHPEYFDAVVSTIPLPYLRQVLPDLPEEYAARAGAVRNVGCRCVLFRLGLPLTDNFWLNTDIAEWDVPGIIEYSNLRPMPAAHVYVPFYMPHSHGNWTLPDEDLLGKARACLMAINPEAAASEQAARIFRYEFAQPVCPPGFRHVLPPYETGIKNLLAADTTHSFPEDRSINESVRVAGELAERLKAGLCG